VKNNSRLLLHSSANATADACKPGRSYINTVARQTDLVVYTGWHRKKVEHLYIYLNICSIVLMSADHQGLFKFTNKLGFPAVRNNADEKPLVQLSYIIPIDMSIFREIDDCE